MLFYLVHTGLCSPDCY